jgi:RHS repeat-associated protein
MKQVSTSAHGSASLPSLGAQTESYYRARYYDQSAGRFLSEDPIGVHGGINFYSYVQNSVADLVDPLGEYAKLDPNSRCAEVFAKAFRPGLCAEAYADEFNKMASKIPVISVPSEDSPTAKLTENQVSGNKRLSTLGSSFFVPDAPIAFTILGGKRNVIVLGPAYGQMSPGLQLANLIHEEVHGVTGYSDAEIFEMLGKFGLPSTDFILNSAHPTAEFSEWILKGCPPRGHH